MSDKVLSSRNIVMGIEPVVNWQNRCENWNEIRAFYQRTTRPTMAMSFHHDWVHQACQKWEQTRGRVYFRTAFDLIWFERWIFDLIWAFDRQGARWTKPQNIWSLWSNNVYGSTQGQSHMWQCGPTIKIFKQCHRWRIGRNSTVVHGTSFHHSKRLLSMIE